MFELFNKKELSLAERSQNAVGIFFKTQNDLITINNEIDQENEILNQQILDLQNDVQSNNNLKKSNSKILENIKKITG